MLKVSRHVLHVRVKLAAVGLEPLKLAAKPPIADRARCQADLLGHFLKREREATVLVGQEHDAPDGHGWRWPCCSAAAKRA